MTSFLRAYGSVPLCVLLCSALALCAQDPGAGELKLIRANYRPAITIHLLSGGENTAHPHLTSHPSVLSAGVHTADFVF